MSGNWKQATLSCETFDYCCNWILSFSEEEGNLTLRVGIVLLKLFHFYFGWHRVLTFRLICSWLCLCHLLVAALVNSLLIFPLPFGIMKMYWVYFYHFFFIDCEKRILNKYPITSSILFITLTLYKTESCTK